MNRVEDYLADHLSTPDRATALALTDSTDARWSYGDLDAAAQALGAALTEKGVAPGDRVMIVSENCAAAVAALFATWRIGAIALPVNARQSRSELQRIMEHADPRAVLLTTDVSPDAVKHAQWLHAHSMPGPWGRIWAAFATASDPYPDPEIAVLLYTTGTTGDPKGVMLTHENVRFGGLTSANLRGMTPRDMIYGVLPTTHVFGLCSVVVAAIYAGAPVRLVPRFEVGAAARWCDAVLSRAANACLADGACQGAWIDRTRFGYIALCLVRGGTTRPHMEARGGGVLWCRVTKRLWDDRNNRRNFGHAQRNR